MANSSQSSCRRRGSPSPGRRQPHSMATLAVVTMTERAFVGEDFCSFGGSAAAGRQIAPIGKNIDVPFGDIGLTDRFAEMRALGNSRARTEYPRENTGRDRKVRIDMPHLARLVYRPAGDGVEVVARETEHRRWLRGLSAFATNSSRVGWTWPPSSHARLCRMAGPPSQRQAMLKRVKAWVAAVRRARLPPALAAVGGDENFCDPSVAGIGDARNLVDARLPSARPGDGEVMNDFTSCTKIELRVFAVGQRVRV